MRVLIVSSNSHLQSHLTQEIKVFLPETVTYHPIKEVK